MAGYDNPITLRYDLASMDFGGTTTVTRAIKGPSGKQGVIRNIGVDLTEGTAWTATDGAVKVGKSGSLAAYAQLNIPTSSAANTTVDVTVDTNAVIADIPADTQVLVTLTPGTGGTLTGIGYPFLEIDWF